ncbi:MAG: hypothetical protein L6Q84_20910 [Polyangiaceae bacterium]|nr:hypothetical protein [Polyangiaceae bacterium]
MNAISRSACLIVVVTGCGGGAPDESPSQSNVVQRGVLSEAPGYQHTFAASRFKPGGSVHEKQELGFVKTAGEQGVFATFAHNGAVLATPNSDAPSLAAPPPAGGPEGHNTRVVGYFVAAGLPKNQIDAVGASSEHFLSGGPEGGRAERFVAWYTVLRRQISGTPVPDSVAWARFSADDDVVAETVYWPPIPAAVLQEAESLKAAASAPAWVQTVADKLPKGATGPGKVVIRHTSFAHRGTFWARAAYDVNYKSGGFATTRHFDSAGNEFKTPEEQQTYPDASTK